MTDNPTTVLAYLQLSLTSLLPERQPGKLLQTMADEQIDPSMMLSLYQVNSDTFDYVATLIANRLVTHTQKASSRLTWFHLRQMAKVETIEYCILQNPLYMDRNPSYTIKELTGAKIGHAAKAAMGSIKSPDADKIATQALYNLYQLFKALAEEPQAAPWWQDGYMAPSKADVDAYMVHLREMVNLTPKS